MSTASFETFSKEYKAVIEREIVEYVNKLEAPAVVKEAMTYSLEAGGKRIRPLLVFAVLEAFGKNLKTGIPAAAAIEMIHTYSLIHDDLPAMDDDDLRRGKPTNHKVFGEAVAVLAGDALLTYSFQLVTDMIDPEVTAEMKLNLVSEIAKSAGAEGMVGGQVADMEGESKQLTLKELEYIHEHKTGKLLTASIISGAILAGANNEQHQHLRDFAYHLGLAFQIRDDILDIEGSVELIGKPVGSDEGNHKSTYPSLLTLDGAKEKLDYHIKLAHNALGKTNLQTSLLNELTNLIATRDH
ncbi:MULTISPECIES: polyprenyl synthetase family protein [unclassified Peribacillus]|uniref:polyprenyl synthetase family protein n=1 Tax=unclassified Peribacillus TaxID=2675266 RepID=UPI0019129F76|nr:MULTISPECIES: farnesyl diphosphate synthase [unclassified Peribacillus]MBK5442495.1 polyprenyl synthetase family protein [Peribacillus sp. TH24]MBK5462759.1 polyprenyl synthetase family protein [Peribacillus sp. TH27]MBK5483903.1 polyprenyl synthetase family protein [Peribacillus sp. TH16]MBK5500910.1 polyprenyl synthetase family protein [Peribacillus sp. TH14]WMX54082.1 polyprenyl synthetase family protein [Peribacillus sp. R9-11]